MELENGGVTAAKGFRAAATEAGIKYQGRADMAMIVSETPAALAGTFTSNVVKAAPVIWDQRIVREEPSARAIVVNAGIANACTGTEGMECCRRTAEAAGRALGIPPEQVLVASTGVIGAQLPIDKLVAGVGRMSGALGASLEHGNAAARAIMTTDTKPKEAAVSFELEGKTVTVGGMCKGSGMIHPDMCTMLSFVTTDLSISKELLQEALSSDVIDTYNMITVDGDTSTNDTVLLLANGLAGNREITGKDDGYRKFVNALNAVNTRLARMIAGDGEGATALFEVRVIHADTKENARKLARSVVGSSLSKAAIFGHDANFGRFLCALGYSGAPFDPDKVRLFAQSNAGMIRFCSGGMADDFDEEEAKRILSEDDVTIIADMGMGEEEAEAFGCDLTYDYVRINADYRS